jgi:hypothetical protein
MGNPMGKILASIGFLLSLTGIVFALSAYANGNLSLDAGAAMKAPWRENR